MQYRFFDIESLSSVFTLASYDSHKEHIRVYILLGENEVKPLPHTKNGEVDPTFVANVTEWIHNKNKENFAHGTVEIIDLSTEEGGRTLSKEFGYVSPYNKNVKIRLRNPVGIRNEKTNETMVYRNGIDLDGTFWKLVADTDREYNPDEHYYILGYNSLNYDTTMLALFFHEAWTVAPTRDEKGQEYIIYAPPTAGDMRWYNDQLFTDKYKRQMPSYLFTAEEADYDDSRNFNDPRYEIRRSLLRTGRYIDVARLNEKQRRVSLKRLLGAIGCQILESDKLGPGRDTIDTDEDLFELIAYNVSDVVNLRTLFETNLYHSQFELKRGMLDTYPELVYLPDKKTGKITRDPSRVRSNRLYTDSTSQQFASRALCPDGTLHDAETVSFMYPAKTKIGETNLSEPYDVVEASRQFFINEVLPHVPDEDKDARLAEFDNVYAYYTDVRGNNFDESKDYQAKYTQNPNEDLKKPDGTARDYITSVSDIQKRPNCIRYIGEDGKPTSCYVVFSIGGIHGAEFNQALYEADQRDYEFAKLNLQLMKNTYGEADGQGIMNDEGIETFIPGPVAAYRDLPEKTAPIPLVFPDGKQHFLKEFVETRLSKGSKNRPGHGTWNKEIAPPPELFVQKSDGSTELNKRYTFTSFAKTNHEDFTSYYPNLLRMMDVFANPEIEGDRYGEIFEGKQSYNKIRKDPSLTQKERDIANLKRDGIKLILNTASGAGDSTFDNPVRMNNNIKAMRIIGQNFTWRIAQAQAIRGARVISTNTDGIYTVLDAEVNNRILEHESGRINVEIEPEEVYLISKDSNNRIEYVHDKYGQPQIISASGGDLACWNGPDTSKSLAHPAIVDRILCFYLMTIADAFGQDALAQPFDDFLGMHLLREAVKEGDIVKRLLLFQNVVVSNANSYSYLYGVDENNQVINLQKDNRVFYMKPDYELINGQPGDVLLRLRKAVGKKITPAQKATRARENQCSIGNIPIIDDPVALQILRAQGVDIEFMRHDDGPREAALEKVNSIDPDWPVLVMNHALLGADEDLLQNILYGLDLNIYLELVHDTYESSWRNTIPQN